MIKPQPKHKTWFITQQDGQKAKADEEAKVKQEAEEKAKQVAEEATKAMSSRRSWGF